MYIRYDLKSIFYNWKFFVTLKWQNMDLFKNILNTLRNNNGNPKCRHNETVHQSAKY